MDESLVFTRPSPLPPVPLTISLQGFGELHGHLSGSKMSTHIFTGPSTTTRSLLPTYYPTTTVMFSTVPFGRLKIVPGWPFRTALVPVYRPSC